MLAVPVEDSRAQRIQRQQSRFRDRGGSVAASFNSQWPLMIYTNSFSVHRIFVPSNKNTLIDILLARSVTGESPVKQRKEREARQRTGDGCSPVRKGKEKEIQVVKASTQNGKRKGVVARKAPKLRLSKVQSDEDAHLEAGSYHMFVLE